LRKSKRKKNNELFSGPYFDPSCCGKSREIRNQPQKTGLLGEFRTQRRVFQGIEALKRKVKWEWSHGLNPMAHEFYLLSFRIETDSDLKSVITKLFRDGWQRVSLLDRPHRRLVIKGIAGLFLKP